MSVRFSSVLIANRGEIACRIIRAARAEGLRTIAVFSDADANAPHVRLADAAIHIGPSAPAGSYLSIGALIDAAKATGAEAVHPGYGFLAENADLAEASATAGLAFVGPPPAAIRAMGDKAAAKARMEEAGVQCAPGYHGPDQSSARFAEEAHRIGYPVMVKAASGGGGRGMRIVREPEALKAALGSARAEAETAFGEGRLLIERALLGARHVEVQVFGDHEGRIVHLGERDCSIQRRHQKVIEEAPSPAVSWALREAMGAAAVKAAAAVGYIGAGTVEFLLDHGPSGDGRFYFLEMNTRIQVEHPVTECVTGVDLVRLQFRVAARAAAPFRAKRRRASWPRHRGAPLRRGPGGGFPPLDRNARRVPTGRERGRANQLRGRSRFGGDAILQFDARQDRRVRGIPRGGAAELLRSLEKTFVAGVKTNRDFLIDALRRPAFVGGAATTAFVSDAPFAARYPSREAIALAAMLFVDRGAPTTPTAGWRATPLTLAADGAERRVSVRRQHEETFVSVGGEDVALRLIGRTDQDARVLGRRRG